MKYGAVHSILPGTFPAAWCRQPTFSPINAGVWLASAMPFAAERVIIKRLGTARNSPEPDKLGSGSPVAQILGSIGHSVSCQSMSIMCITSMPQHDLIHPPPPSPGIALQGQVASRSVIRSSNVRPCVTIRSHVRVAPIPPSATHMHNEASELERVFDN